MTSRPRYRLQAWEYALLAALVVCASVLIAQEAHATLVNLLWWLYR